MNLSSAPVVWLRDSGRIYPRSPLLLPLVRIINLHDFGLPTLSRNVQSSANEFTIGEDKIEDGKLLFR
jgi:hypothetical protein